MDKKYDEIGFRLKKLRGSRSQAKFANEIGTTLRAYQHYEAGERVPHIHLLTNIASLCDTTVDWILTGQVDMQEARMHEQCKRSLYMAELIEKLEKSIEREGRLLYKYTDSSAAANDQALLIEDEKAFIKWLKDWIDGDSDLGISIGQKNPLQNGVQSGINEGEQLDPLSAEIVAQLRDMADTDRQTILETIKEKKLLRKLLKAQEDKGGD